MNTYEPDTLYPLGKAPASTGFLTSSTQILVSLGGRFTSMFKAKVTLPSAPASVDNYSQVHDWPLYDRDKAQDCTCAAAGHMIMTWTTIAQGQCDEPSNPSILSVYDKVKYRSSTNPNTTCSMVSVLQWWRDSGIAGHRIQDYSPLNIGAKDSVRNSINLLGCCYIGLQLPEFLFHPDVDAKTAPWVVHAAGTDGPDTRMNPNRGHAVAGLGYDDRNITFVTWGRIKTMTWEFYEAYSDEAYAVLSPDWFGQAGSPRYGLQLAVLANQLARVG